MLEGEELLSFSHAKVKLDRITPQFPREVHNADKSRVATLFFRRKFPFGDVSLRSHFLRLSPVNKINAQCLRSVYPSYVDLFPKRDGLSVLQYPHEIVTL